MLHLVLVLFLGLDDLGFTRSGDICDGKIAASYSKLGSNTLFSNVRGSDEVICYYLDYSGDITMTVDGDTYENPLIHCPLSDSNVTFEPSDTVVRYTEAFVHSENITQYSSIYISTTDF